MIPAFQFLGTVIIVMAVLTWQQPSALFSLARMIERGAARIVLEIRVRGCALLDARAAYSRSAAWHRGRL